MIGIKQGETLNFNLNIIDTLDAPMDLVGSTAIFAYKLKDSKNEPITGKCTIGTSKITFILSSTETATMKGIYSLEVKLKDSLGNVDSVYSEDISVKESIIPNYISL